MGQRIEDERVAWIPPEVKHQLLGDQVAQPNNPYVGEYRHGKADGTFGSLVVWVDDVPNDPRNGAGHFELWAGKPENYHPLRSNS